MSSDFSFVSAQFSILYSLSAALVAGQFGPEQLLNSSINNPEIINLSKKVHVIADDELNKIYPDKTASRVEISLKSGKKLIQQVDIPKGDPRNPMNLQEIIAKMQLFSSKPEAECAKIADTAMNIETMKDIRRLVTMIKGGSIH